MGVWGVLCFLLGCLFVFLKASDVNKEMHTKWSLQYFTLSVP